MVRWFDDPSTDDSSDDLPWASEYVREPDVINRQFNVTEVYVTPKGLLMICTRFKAFVFKRQEMHDYILEALEAWVKDNTARSHLVARIVKDGKVHYGLDDENDMAYWVQDGKKYAKKQSTGVGFTSEPTANPLLPPPSAYEGVPQGTTATQGDTPTKRRSTRP